MKYMVSKRGVGMKLNLLEKSDYSDLKIVMGKDFSVGDLKDSALFIIDMNNGFSKKGALYSDRVEAIIDNVKEITEIFADKDLPIIAYTDYHNKNSIEFKSYPHHCLEGTDEVELVDAIKVFKDKIKVIRKNSTNAFLSNETQEIIGKLKDKNIKNYVVIGCCTDICIMQFALTLKAYFNENNMESEVYIPLKGVETYDAPWHKGDVMNHFAIYTMQQNGVNIVNSIRK